jgi:hypothetical protein
VTEEGLPLAVIGFIENCLTSIEQMEILLLLARQPDTTWTVQSVYEVILSTKPSVETWLQNLVDTGLAERLEGSPAGYRFHAATPEIGSAVRLLGESYQARPVRVIEAIYKRSAIQSDAAKSFADAFRFRKN